MKFNCDRCQTRYSIGDDKVQGKVLKIRCKTCGNIVVVREQTSVGLVAESLAKSASAGAAAGGQVRSPTQVGASALPPPPASGSSPSAPRGEIEWYVAIKGKQHGPASRDEVVRLFKEGKISERTYLWHEAMPSWTRFKDVPQFAGIAQEASPQRRPPPPPVEDAQQGAEIIPFDEARRAREHDSRGMPRPEVFNDPFAALGTPHSGVEPPRDSTRVFIMQAGLHNRNQKHKVYAGVAAVVLLLFTFVCVLDYQGVIEIPGLHSVVNVVARKTDPAPVALLEDPAAIWDTAEEDPALKCKLLPNPAECVKQTIALNEKRRARKKAKADLLAADNFGTGTGPATAGVLKRQGTIGVGGAADISNTGDAAAIAAVFQNERKKITVPKPRIEKVAVSGAEIDAESVSKTISQNRDSIGVCVEQGAKIGKIPGGRQVLILSIEPNGRVSKATFRNGATAASPVGECIRGAARRWKFQPFPGDAADVEVPLVLSVGM